MKTRCITALAMSCFAIMDASSAAETDAPLTTTTAKDSGAQIDDIVVTARRVAESEQKVPVPVTAFGSAELANLSVQNATDLSGRAPNVQIAETGAGTGAMQVFIRGIGNDSLAFNLENPVGVYLDDVYMGRLQGALLDNLDFDRIEVLRGPQGTLYGRNSTVGALKYVTKDPDLDAEHYKASATFGDYSRFDTSASASIPLIAGVLATKIDVGTRSEVGYLQGVDANGKPNGQTADGINRQNARIATLWLPAEDWRVNIAADYSIDRSGTSQGTPLVSAADPTAACNSAASACAPLYGSPYRTGINNANEGHNKVAGLSAHVDNTTSWGSFKSITAYRRLDNFDAIDLSDVAGVNFQIPDTKKQNQISQEFQVASKADQALTWLGGVFYYRESIYHFADFIGVQLNDDHQISNSYAAFADATYRIIENLHFELGGRYSKDDKTIDRAVLPAAGGPATIAGSSSFSTEKATYKAGLDYEVLPDVMTYVTYSTGYRPGSFASTYAYPAVPAVLFGHTKDETAENLEVGVKSEWLDRRLRVNLSGFHTDYKDLQQQSSAFPYPITTYNIALKGLELETQARPIGPITLNGTLGMLDARITSGTKTGDRPRLTPKVQYSLSGEYKTELREGIDFFGGANLVHTSTYTTDDSNIPSVTQDAYSLVGAQIGLEFASGRYRVSIDGKNLTNKAYFVATSPDVEQYFGPPRMIYGSVTARF